MLARIKDYASAANGLEVGCDVFIYEPPASKRVASPSKSPNSPAKSSSGPPPQGYFNLLVSARSFEPLNEPHPDQRIVYVDGGFDLFGSGHIEFLRQVVEAETKIARDEGWFAEDWKQERIRNKKKDYSPVFIVAGVHDDEVVNDWKGINYPIMNIFERGLCVLGCKV